MDLFLTFMSLFEACSLKNVEIRPNWYVSEMMVESGDNGRDFKGTTCHIIGDEGNLSLVNLDHTLQQRMHMNFDNFSVSF
jgi:hypothetical protein